MSSLTNDVDSAPASWRNLAEHLYRHFYAATQDQCLLWVDPARADPFEENDVAERSRIRVPIRHPRFDPARAPYLVQLDLSRSTDADLFTSSVELAWRSWDIDQLNVMQGQPISGWVTGNDAAAVAGHWGRHCHVHTVQRHTTLLRFQDPGVREWLWPTLARKQQRTLLGAATEVLAVGRMHKLIRHADDDLLVLPSGTDGEMPERLGALVLSETQWHQLDDYATLHAAWLTWRNSTTDEVDTAQQAGWEGPVFRALAQADLLGIRDASDRELFALHALQLGPAFHQNPRLSEVWQQTRAGEFYGNAVEAAIGCPADHLAEWARASEVR